MFSLLFPHIPEIDSLNGSRPLQKGGSMVGSLGITLLRDSYIVLLLIGPFAKSMLTKSLKLNLRLTQYHLKYWNWPRATGLPRVGEGRGGPPEEVIEPTIFSVLKQLCS